jgi:ATP-binding cassette subfamily G (WHITE) protein 2
LEQKYGKKVKDLYLVRLHPDAEEKNYELIKLPDLTKDIIDLFENVILMNKGNIVYQGKMDSLYSFFENQGLTIINDNPFIEIIDFLINKECLTDNKIIDLNNYHLMDIEKNISHQKITWVQQFVILLKKNFLLSARSWQRIFINLLVTSIIAIFVGLSVWNDIGTNKKSFTLRQPSLFFCVISQGIISSIQGTYSFTLDRNLMIRERDSGTYNISAYFLSKTICENIIQSLSPILFTCIVYPLIGYQLTVKQFFYFMLFMIMDSISATSLANMVCCICQSIELSTIVLSLLFEISRLYGGWFIPPKLINTAEYDKWKFADTLSYIKYAFIGVSLNENSNLLLTCDKNEYVNNACNIIPAQISPFTGSKINHFYGYDDYTIQYCYAALLIYIITCRIISYISLRLQ